MDIISHYTPDDESVLPCDMERLEHIVVWNEPCTIAGGVKAVLFQRKFTVNRGYHKIAIARLDASVNDQNVVVENPCIDHRVARDTGIESSFGMSIHIAHEVDTLACIVGSGRRETGMQAIGKPEFDPFRFGICDVRDFQALVFIV